MMKLLGRKSSWRAMRELFSMAAASASTPALWMPLDPRSSTRRDVLTESALPRASALCLCSRKREVGGGEGTGCECRKVE